MRCRRCRARIFGWALSRLPPDGRCRTPARVSGRTLPRPGIPEGTAAAVARPASAALESPGPVPGQPESPPPHHRFGPQLAGAPRPDVRRLPSAFARLSARTARCAGARPSARTAGQAATLAAARRGIDQRVSGAGPAASNPAAVRRPSWHPGSGSPVVAAETASPRALAEAASPRALAEAASPVAAAGAAELAPRRGGPGRSARTGSRPVPAGLRDARSVRGSAGAGGAPRQHGRDRMPMSAGPGRPPSREAEASCPESRRRGDPAAVDSPPRRHGRRSTSCPASARTRPAAPSRTQRASHRP
jgi:hypothetical protein